MVSIPDWNRFRGMGDQSKETANSESKYSRQREEEYIKKVEENGYFLNPSRSYIETNFIEKQEECAKKKKRISILDKLDKKQRDLGELLLLKLRHARMRGVGDIGLCNRLTICILSNNYITRFDGLVSCVNLIKLDLHNNQISVLPTGAFWGGLRKLRILHLHDNPIGHIDNLHFLSNSPVLNVLTLFDTPLSLKKNYRHHVVNSIWSLKALDWHVISDEEIIEDADFGGKFAALGTSLKLELCPPLPEDASYEEEIGSVKEVLQNVNIVLSHNSPVIVIQRYMRGFLYRRHLKLVHDLKICGSDDDKAAVTIQRKFREWKGLDTPRKSHMPPPPSPMVGEQATKSGTTVNRTSPPQGQVKVTSSLPAAPVDEVKLDYDTYLRNRRPGSTGFSEASMSSRYSRKQATEHDKLVMPTLDTLTSVTPATSATEERGSRKNLVINLSKLQATTMQNLEEEAIAMETSGPSEVTFAARGDREQTEAIKKAASKYKKEPEKKRIVIKSVKQFFGPILENPQSPVEDKYFHVDEEIPRINFRLRGMAQQVTYYDPTTDMIIARKEAGMFARAAEDEYHTKKNMAKPPEKCIPRDHKKSQKRKLAQSLGGMSLTCLNAVQHAYKERQRAEKHASKLECVLNMRDQRDTAKERIRLYQEERRNKALKEREEDQQKMIEVIEKRELKTTNYLNRNKEHREKSSSHLKHRRGEYSFMVDFNVQNSSVSNALLRHDRQARHEDRFTEAIDKTQTHRNLELEQRNVVQTYMEHRQLMRQTETSIGRAAIDAKMLQDANERLMEARQRVAQQKARNAQVQALYPAAPSISSHSLPAMDHDKMKAMKGLDRWNSGVLLNQGRVGKHPVSTVQ